MDCGAGADRVVAGAGDDNVLGGDGRDTVSGGDGSDTVRSGTGDDLLHGGHGDDSLCGGADNDIVHGDEGNDVLWGQQGDDHLAGGEGSDLIVGGNGSDYMAGCYGNDFLLSRSDAGEPAPASGAARATAGAMPTGNDKLIGGLHADTYRFELMTNARSEVLAGNLRADGTVDWDAVIAEDGAAHDHWVDSIGNDSVVGYSRADGDRIEIIGHSVAVSLQHLDTNRDGRADRSLITLRSDPESGGAHAGDALGTITVFGDLVQLSDLVVDGSANIGAFARPVVGNPFPGDGFGSFPTTWGGFDVVDWM